MSLEEGDSTIDIVTSRFWVTTETLWFNASLVSSVATKSKLMSASPKETGVDHKRTQSSGSEMQLPVGSDIHRWNHELDKDHLSCTDVIAKSLHSSVRHPKSFSSPIIMEAFILSGLAVSDRRNEGESETVWDREMNKLVPESTVISCPQGAHNRGMKTDV